ncbi:hypothetical protein MRB53_040196 [Persea americana]|nr:hypothetical protein MRB53_040196 [Persea americana]
MYKSNMCEPDFRVEVVDVATNVQNRKLISWSSSGNQYSTDIGIHIFTETVHVHRNSKRNFCHHQVSCARWENYAISLIHASLCPMLAQGISIALGAASSLKRLALLADPCQSCHGRQHEKRPRSTHCMRHCVLCKKASGRAFVMNSGGAKLLVVSLRIRIRVRLIRCQYTYCSVLCQWW